MGKIERENTPLTFLALQEILLGMERYFSQRPELIKSLNSAKNGLEEVTASEKAYQNHLQEALARFDDYIKQSPEDVNASLIKRLLNRCLGASQKVSDALAEGDIDEVAQAMALSIGAISEYTQFEGQIADWLGPKKAIFDVQKSSKAAPGGLKVSASGTEEIASVPENKLAKAEPINSLLSMPYQRAMRYVMLMAELGRQLGKVAAKAPQQVALKLDEVNRYQSEILTANDRLKEASHQVNNSKALCNARVGKSTLGALLFAEMSGTVVQAERKAKPLTVSYLPGFTVAISLAISLHADEIAAYQVIVDKFNSNEQFSAVAFASLKEGKLSINFHQANYKQPQALEQIAVNRKHLFDDLREFLHANGADTSQLDVLLNKEWSEQAIVATQVFATFFNDKQAAVISQFADSDKARSASATQRAAGAMAFLQPFITAQLLSEVDVKSFATLVQKAGEAIETDKLLAVADIEEVKRLSVLIQSLADVDTAGRPVATMLVQRIPVGFHRTCTYLFARFIYPYVFVDAKFIPSTADEYQCFNGLREAIGKVPLNENQQFTRVGSVKYDEKITKVNIGEQTFNLNEMLQRSIAKAKYDSDALEALENELMSLTAGLCIDVSEGLSDIMAKAKAKAKAKADTRVRLLACKKRCDVGEKLANLSDSEFIHRVAVRHFFDSLVPPMSSQNKTERARKIVEHLTKNLEDKKFRAFLESIDIDVSQLTATVVERYLGKKTMLIKLEKAGEKFTANELNSLFVDGFPPRPIAPSAALQREPSTVSSSDSCSDDSDDDSQSAAKRMPARPTRPAPTPPSVAASIGAHGGPLSPHLSCHRNQVGSPQQHLAPPRSLVASEVGENEPPPDKLSP